MDELKNINASKIITEYKRLNVVSPHAFFVPYSENQVYKFSNKILDKKGSDRLTLLNGEWNIKEYNNVEQVNLEDTPTNKIPVPACVQLHGYDQIQYINLRYPIPVDPPFVPSNNPTYHYNRTVNLGALDKTQKYYMVFEGVDSCFFLFINKKFVGYGQITHATNEFEVSEFLNDGINQIDVVVVKWCAGSYLEDQDKFRYTGIIRDVYILRRPLEHITDYKITTDIVNKKGIVTLENLSSIAFNYTFLENFGALNPNQKITFEVDKPRIWSAEKPRLYDLEITANGEKILNRIGIRRVEIDNGIFKINGKHIKLKGVNRHESHPKTGAVVTVKDTIQDLKLMKWANVNAIRTSHYPDAPEFYELCNAYGFYVCDEADIECHGLGVCEGQTDWSPRMRYYVDNDTFTQGVTDRIINLYERDKNNSCVVIWSLANESGYGKMFYDGADYIRAKDNRPIHNEGMTMPGNDEYYTDRLDMVSRMYAGVSFFDKFLADEKETRPYLLCEYNHAMGNSCGDMNEYWKKIDSNDRFMGGFVWEWCDHAVKSKKGYLYGGDFGEFEHDGNFCVDGLVSPDRKIKSSLREVRAVYGGKREYEFVPPKSQLDDKPNLGKNASVTLSANGSIESIGELKFDKPFGVNISRAYIDNDGISGVKAKWERFNGWYQEAYNVQKQGNITVIDGKIVRPYVVPLLTYKMTIEEFEGGIDLTFDYTVAEFMDYLPRIGFEFSLDKNNCAFRYKGYGPTESYVDKHLACEYGEYENTAEGNFNDYIMPQENGSHFASTELELEGAFKVTAEKPFSFSVLPYSTEQLNNAKHNFELKKTGKTYVNLDLAMSGVASGLDGGKLMEKYYAPKTGSNKFRIILK